MRVLQPSLGLPASSLSPAPQMDIKVEGITLDIMQRALAAAGEGRRHILGEMAKCSPAPRRALSQYAPRLLQVGCAVAGGAAAHAVTSMLSYAVLCCATFECSVPPAASLP